MKFICIVLLLTSATTYASDWVFVDQSRDHYDALPGDPRWAEAHYEISKFYVDRQSIHLEGQNVVAWIEGRSFREKGQELIPTGTSKRVMLFDCANHKYKITDVVEYNDPQNPMEATDRYNLDNGKWSRLEPDSHNDTVSSKVCGLIKSH